ncbi:MAG: endonuclease, partial [Bacteroidota bacterium]
FFIPSGGSITCWIRFSPRHNIFHNSELIIEDDGLRGPLRIDLLGQGRFSNSYYSSTEDLAEEPLKNAFHTLLALNYDTLGYVVARDSMFMQIDNLARNGQGATQNTIESCYTGALAAGYVDRTDCQTTFSFNTEHTFPQSFFSSLEPMRSDLHHLYACDDLSNNQRGNNPFGIVNGNIVWSGGGSKSDGSYFEPRDAQKGKASRSLLYFVLRYQDYVGFVQPQEALLRNWHAAFPPGSIERRRNDDIFTDQHNRNPFVDYPQFIERIQSVATLSVAPLVQSLDLPVDTIVYGFVAAGTTATYSYVIVNKGNQTVQLSNFTLSLTAVYSFVGGTPSITLQPGEALVVRILAAPLSSASANAQLTYSTSIVGQSTITVPIYLNDAVVNSVSDAPHASLRIFPNPTDGLVRFSSGIGSGRLTVSDPLGRTLLERSDLPLDHGVIDLSFLPAGVYRLRIDTEYGASIHSLLKR